MLSLVTSPSPERYTTKEKKNKGQRTPGVAGLGGNRITRYLSTTYLTTGLALIWTVLRLRPRNLSHTIRFASLILIPARIQNPRQPI